MTFLRPRHVCDYGKARRFQLRTRVSSLRLPPLLNFAHELFTALANWLYHSDMRDPATMYKVFRREAVAGVKFRRNRFDFDWELLMKLVRKGYRPIEIPISYKSRSFKEGKKITMFRDPLTWLWALVKYRIKPL